MQQSAAPTCGCRSAPALVLLSAGAAGAAGASLNHSQPPSRPSHCLLQELQDLASISSPETAAASRTAAALRQRRVAIRLCRASYDLLTSFLQLPRQLAMLGIVNERIKFEVLTRYCHNTAMVPLLCAPMLCLPACYRSGMLSMLPTDPLASWQLASQRACAPCNCVPALRRCLRGSLPRLLSWQAWRRTLRLGPCRLMW